MKTLLICVGLLVSAVAALFADDVPVIADAIVWRLGDAAPLLMAGLCLAVLRIGEAKPWALLTEAVRTGLSWCIRHPPSLAMQKLELDFRMPLRQSGYGPVWA